jgi:hypothetical protein
LNTGAVVGNGFVCAKLNVEIADAAKIRRNRFM